MLSKHSTKERHKKCERVEAKKTQLIFQHIIYMPFTAGKDTRSSSSHIYISLIIQRLKQDTIKQGKASCCDCMRTKNNGEIFSNPSDIFSDFYHIFLV